MADFSLSFMIALVVTFEIGWIIQHFSLVGDSLFIIFFKNKLTYSSILVTVSLLIRIKITRKCSNFNVHHRVKISSSARCVSAANFICRHTDVQSFNRKFTSLTDNSTCTRAWSLFKLLLLFTWSSRWNENWQGKPKYSEKGYPSATLSITNPTWLDLGSNPGCRGGKPATNRLSYGAAF
jgi:hypothetical protein